jgi:hypothetical protein
MSERPAGRRAAPRPAAGLLLAALVTLSACAPAGRVQIRSYKDPYFPEDFEVRFEQCAFLRDGTRDYHVVARSTRVPQGAEIGPVTQILHVHVFWKPRPGKTFDDPSTHTATLRYAIVTSGGVALYEGAGFVFPQRRWIDGALVAQIEQARLSPRLRIGEAPELLGESHLAGTLEAAANAPLTVDLRRELELHAGRAAAAAP